MPVQVQVYRPTETQFSRGGGVQVCYLPTVGEGRLAHVGTYKCATKINFSPPERN